MWCKIGNVESAQAKLIAGYIIATGVSLSGIAKRKMRLLAIWQDNRLEMNYMTMLPMYKKCSRCKRRYLWNPDVGKMWCPYCGPLGQVGWGDIPWKKIDGILKGNKNKK